jgi:hypothetical protein
VFTIKARPPTSYPFTISNETNECNALNTISNGTVCCLDVGELAESEASRFTRLTIEHESKSGINEDEYDWANGYRKATTGPTSLKISMICSSLISKGIFPTKTTRDMDANGEGTRGSAIEAARSNVPKAPS